ncbi:MAG: hypothetical protein R2752_04880 [Vicinamibacterales bacterium]
MPAPDRFSRLEATRIVATPAALDAARWPAGAVVLRIAPDEAIVTGAVAPAAIEDPHAIVARETGFVGAWMEAAAAEALLERACAWARPAERPAFAQGLVAGLPVKLWLDVARVLVVAPAAFAHDCEARLR